jgi:uncharacterized OB-fold protein
VSGSWPLPDLEHPLYGPHWAAARQSRLALQRCERCSYLRWPPEPVCPECLLEGGRWDDVPGAGSVWSFAVYEHAFEESLRAELPYVCALVELDAGPRLIGRLVDLTPPEAEIGMRVEAVFPEIAPGVRVVCFAPAAGRERPVVASPD